MSYKGLCPVHGPHYEEKCPYPHAGEKPEAKPEPRREDNWMAEVMTSTSLRHQRAERAMQDEYMRYAEVGERVSPSTPPSNLHGVIRDAIVLLNRGDDLNALKLLRQSLRERGLATGK